MTIDQEYIQQNAEDVMCAMQWTGIPFTTPWDEFPPYFKDVVKAFADGRPSQYKDADNLAEFDRLAEMHFPPDQLAKYREGR